MIGTPLLADKSYSKDKSSHALQMPTLKHQFVDQSNAFKLCTYISVYVMLFKSLFSW